MEVRAEPLINYRRGAHQRGVIGFAVDIQDIRRRRQLTIAGQQREGRHHPRSGQREDVAEHGSDVRFMELLAEPVGHVFVLPVEADQRAFAHVADDFHHVVQPIAIQTAAG